MRSFKCDYSFKVPWVNIQTLLGTLQGLLLLLNCRDYHLPNYAMTKRNDTFQEKIIRLVSCKRSTSLIPDERLFFSAKTQQGLVVLAVVADGAL